MRTLIWTNTFLRALKKVTKRDQQCRQEIENTLRLLAADPFAPQLHKMPFFVILSEAKNLSYAEHNAQAAHSESRARAFITRSLTACRWKNNKHASESRTITRREELITED
jgi:hypothetical protein